MCCLGKYMPGVQCIYVLSLDYIFWVYFCYSARAGFVPPPMHVNFNRLFENCSGQWWDIAENYARKFSTSKELNHFCGPPVANMVKQSAEVEMATNLHITCW